MREHLKKKIKPLSDELSGRVTKKSSSEASQKSIALVLITHDVFLMNIAEREGGGQAKELRDAAKKRFFRPYSPPQELSSKKKI